MPHEEEELLTVEEVAKHLRVDERTVRRWINKGDLIAIDLGRGYRISRANLNDFKQRRQTGKQKDA